MGAHTTHRGSVLGESIRRHRRRAGVAQTRLASAAGVDPARVGAWERGEILPTFDQARMAGKELRVPAVVLDEWIALIRAASSSAPSIPDEVRARLLEALGPADPFSSDQTSLDGAVAGKANGGRRRSNGGSSDKGAASIPRPSIGSGNWGRPPHGTVRVTRASLPTPVGRRPVPPRTNEAQELRQRAPASVREERRARTEPSGRSPRSMPPPVPSVFPMPGPAAAADPEWWVYSAAPPNPWDAKTRVFYFGRRLRTLGVLAALALLLVWAVGELSEGLAAAFDLLGDSAPAVTESSYLTG